MSDLWNVGNDEILVIAKSSGVIGEEWNRIISDLDAVHVINTKKGGRGVLAFDDPEKAKKYVQDSAYQDAEIVKTYYMAFVASLKEWFPDITCLIIDPLYGYEDFSNIRPV